ncbi:MAG: GIY-YIG nuclease family protein [Bacteroidota bacterium]
MIFVYILQSTVTGRYYVGHTKDKENRLREHNTGETMENCPCRRV